MSSYEGSAKGYYAFLALELMVVGGLLGSIIKGGVDDVDGKVRDVQIQHEQVEEQLQRDHTLGKLLLNLDGTFSFTSPTEGSCTGTYESSGEGDTVTAKVVGPLACTQTVPAVP